MSEQCSKCQRPGRFTGDPTGIGQTMCQDCMHKWDVECIELRYKREQAALASQVQAVVEAIKAYHEAQRRTFGDVKIVHSGRCGAELQAVIDAADRLSTLAQEGT